MCPHFSKSAKWPFLGHQPVVFPLAMTKNTIARVRVPVSASRVLASSDEMSYGGGYGGSGSPPGNNRPRGVGSFNPNEPMGTSYNNSGGNYGQGGYGNQGQGQFTSRPAAGTFSIPQAGGGYDNQQGPGGGFTTGGAGIQPRGGGGYGGNTTGGGYGGYQGPPRGAEALPPRGPSFGGPAAGGGYDRQQQEQGYQGGRGYQGGYGGNPTQGGYDARNQGQGVQMQPMGQQSQMQNTQRQPQPSAQGGAAPPSTFSLANTHTPVSPRLPSTFMNPAREVVRQQNQQTERPTFSLAGYGISGDNATAHQRASAAGSGASSPTGNTSPTQSASPPGGGFGDVRGGSSRPMYVGADFPPTNEVPAASPASATFAHASTLVQRRLAQNTANALAGTSNRGGQGHEFGCVTSTAGNSSSGLTAPSTPRRAAAVPPNKFDTRRSFRAPAQKRPLLTSATLNLHLYLGWCFFGTFVVFGLLILIWKGCRLPYPGTGTNVWGLDVAYLIAYSVIEPARLTLTTIANKALKAKLMYLSVLLAVPGFCLHAYYAWGQTYALKIDVFLNVCGMGIIGAQVALSLFIVGAFPGGVLGGVGVSAGFRGTQSATATSRTSNNSALASAQRRFGGFRVR